MNVLVFAGIPEVKRNVADILKHSYIVVVIISGTKNNTQFTELLNKANQ